MLSDNKIVRARSTEEYVDMVKQAIDETFDLKQAIEYDEFMDDARECVDTLEPMLVEIYDSMKDGSYQFATGDLPYIELIEKYHPGLIPFKYLLKRINETHNKGLQI